MIDEGMESDDERTQQWEQEQENENENENDCAAVDDHTDDHRLQSEGEMEYESVLDHGHGFDYDCD